MARRMVTSFGMSDIIGLMAVGDSEQEVFLGRELGQRRQVSEHTAQQVDQEVKRILDEAHDKARVILEQHRDLLERIAQALLERETIGQDEIRLLDRGDPLPPMEPVVEEAAAGTTGDQDDGRAPAGVGLPGGEPEG
jgi:cell division protease FtsH